MNLVLIGVLIGSLTVTSYRSVPSQTDRSPFHTSTGERVHTGGVAISQDLLCGACRKLHRRCAHPEYEKKLHYGDYIYLKSVGFKVINDCMGKFNSRKVLTKNGYKRIFKRQTKGIDIWVPFLEDEKRFHKKYGISKQEVFKVKFLGEEYVKEEKK